MVVFTLETDYPSETSVKTASVGTYLSFKILGGGVPPGSPNPDPISNPNKCHFSHPFSDLASKHLCPFSDLVSLLRLERPQWYWAYSSATVLPVRRHLRFGIIYYVFPFWCISFRVGNQQWSAVFLDAWLRQQQQVRRTGNTPWAVSSPSLTRRRYYLGP